MAHKASNWPAIDSGKRWLPKHRLGRLVTWESSLISDKFQWCFVMFIRFFNFLYVLYFQSFLWFSLSNRFCWVIIWSLWSFFYYWVVPPSRLFLSLKVAFLNLLDSELLLFSLELGETDLIFNEEMVRFIALPLLSFSCTWMFYSWASCSGEYPVDLRLEIRQRLGNWWRKGWLCSSATRPSTAYVWHVGCELSWASFSVGVLYGLCG